MSIPTPVRHNVSEIRGSRLRTLFNPAAAKAFAKNTLIFTESNRPADSVYMIESGRIKLFLSNSDGKEIDIGVLGPGEIFGDTELDAGPRSVSAMAVEPSRLVVVRQSEFRQLVEEDPRFAMELVLKLISRNRDLLKTVKSLALMDVTDRVAQLLLEMATEENGKLIINEKVSKRNIANRVGATREMASRVFRDLVASGYIEMENKKITISRKMAGLLVSGGLVGLIFVLAPSSDHPGGTSVNIASAINNLPATAAGAPSLVAPAATPAAQIADTVASGRVKQFYIRTAEGVFAEAGRAPDPQRQNLERWAEIEFAESVAGTAGSIRALLGGARDEFSVGDIVEVRFARPGDVRAAAVSEPARVTGLVARKSDVLAIDFERRILARNRAPLAQPK